MAEFDDDSNDDSGIEQSIDIDQIKWVHVDGDMVELCFRDCSRKTISRAEWRTLETMFDRRMVDYLEETRTIADPNFDKILSRPHRPPKINPDNKLGLDMCNQLMNKELSWREREFVSSIQSQIMRRPADFEMSDKRLKWFSDIWWRYQNITDVKET